MSRFAKAFLAFAALTKYPGTYLPCARRSRRMPPRCGRLAIIPRRVQSPLPFNGAYGTGRAKSRGTVFQLNTEAVDSVNDPQSFATLKAACTGLAKRGQALPSRLHRHLPLLWSTSGGRA